jgi:hypothetical protein
MILPRIRKKRKMKQMKILTVSGSIYFWPLISSVSRVAEEYYKNDYPDEIDSSGSSGKCPNPCYIVISYIMSSFLRRIP